MEFHCGQLVVLLADSVGHSYNRSWKTGWPGLGVEFEELHTVESGEKRCYLSDLWIRKGLQQNKTPGFSG